MSHAANLIQILEDGMADLQERNAQRVAKGRATQEKADAVYAEIRAEVDAAIAAIKEVEEHRGEEVVECIKTSQAQSRDTAGIIALADRLMKRA